LIKELLRVLFKPKCWQIGSIKVAPLFVSKIWFFLSRERNSNAVERTKFST